MRIVWLIPGFDGYGGSERSLAAMVPHYLECGVELEIAIFTPRTNLCSAMERRGVRVRRLDGPGGYAGIVARLHRLVGNRNVDLLHTSLFNADLVGRLAAMGTRVPVLTTLASTPPDAGSTPGVPRWKLAAAREVDAVSGSLLTTHFHAVTEGVKVAAVRRMRWSPDRVTVVERGRDPGELGSPSPARTAAARAALGLDADDEVVVALGRQVADKGQEHLVEAVAKLQTDNEHLVLLLAGAEGDATRRIRDARTAAPDPSRIRELGHRDDAAELLAAADVFALPSLREGAAGAAIEAMALGLPIAASRLDGLHGVLADERNALIVPRCDSGALATALDRLLRDRALRTALGSAGRSDFVQRFTLERSAARLLALSAEVAARGRRHRGRRTKTSTRRELDLPSASG